jgi:formate hydrogenlyase transcriptional activator
MIWLRSGVRETAAVLARHVLPYVEVSRNGVLEPVSGTKSGQDRPASPRRWRHGASSGVEALAVPSLVEVQKVMKSFRKNSVREPCSQARDFVVHESSWHAPREFVEPARTTRPALEPWVETPYRQLFAQSAAAMLLLDPWGDLVLDANGAASSLLERPLDQLIGRRASALHPSQLAYLQVFTEEILERGQARSELLELRRADGSRKVLEYAATRVDLGSRTLIFAVVDDLQSRRLRCARREAVQRIRRGDAWWRDVEHFFRDLERENRLILSAAGEGIYGVNADGITTFVNPAAERVLGWTAEEMVGRTMHELVHHTHADGAHYPQEDCPIYAAFRDGTVHRVDNEVFWSKDGEPVFVEYTSTPIRDRGVLIGAVVVFRDITPRREAEERLRAALAEVNQLRQRLEMENAYLQEEIRTERAFDGIIGTSAPTRKIIEQIELVAPTSANVLIVGESGTGKELIAHAIHSASSRSERPLIRVNCAAIPRELFESEFFGHVRGAFTGALRDRVGRFELADGGTLFLDEIGEIPPELQSKLLCVLQDGQVERVGEERTRKVDVRVIAATNRNLEEEVRRGRFRQDLYFRLNVFPIHSVPLRERPDDIAPLAAEFVKRACMRAKKTGVKLTQGDLRSLLAYDWPGNVRELENVIERAVILGHGGRLRLELPVRQKIRDIPSPRCETGPAEPPGESVLTESQRRQRDRENILAALEACNGKVFGKGGAAELMGIPPTTLSSRMKILGINRAQLQRTPSADTA